MQVNSVSLMTYQARNDAQARSQQQAFGRVIKTRFFEVLPDGSKAQIQDFDELKEVCRRMMYHLNNPKKRKKARIDTISQTLANVDKDYQRNPSVRRIFNLNRYYDRCAYLITGNDADFLSDVARTTDALTRKTEVIQNQWGLVRQTEKRLSDEKGKELALNVILRRNPESGSKKSKFFYKGMEFIQEKYMQFPYRMRNQNLP